MDMDSKTVRPVLLVSLCLAQTSTQNRRWKPSSSLFGSNWLNRPAGRWNPPTSFSLRASLQIRRKAGAALLPARLRRWGSPARSPHLWSHCHCPQSCTGPFRKRGHKAVSWGLHFIVWPQMQLWNTMKTEHANKLFWQMCVIFPPKGVYKKPGVVLHTGKGVMPLKWVSLN